MRRGEEEEKGRKRMDVLIPSQTYLFFSAKKPQWKKGEKKKRRDERKNGLSPLSSVSNGETKNRMRRRKRANRLFSFFPISSTT